MRKLASNFLSRGKMRTTLKKAKLLVSLVDTLVTKAKEKNEANKNYLLRRLGRRELVDMLFEKVAPRFPARPSGYTKITRLLRRESDSADMAKVQWIEET